MRRPLNDRYFSKKWDPGSRSSEVPGVIYYPWTIVGIWVSFDRGRETMKV